MNILFVCTGNIFRSLTAELALKKALEDDPRFDISSAGTNAEQESILPYVNQQLLAHGLDPANHKQRRLTKELLEQADAVIAMNSDHQEFIKNTFDREVFVFGDLTGNAHLNFSDIREAVPDWDKNQKAAARYTKKVIKGIVTAMPGLATRLKKQPLSDARDAPTFIIEEYKNKWAYLMHTEEMEFKLTQWYLVVAGGLLAFAFSDFDDFDKAIQDPLTPILLLFVVIYSAFLCFFLLVQKGHYARHLNRLVIMEKIYGGLEPQVPEGRFITSFRARYILIVFIGSGCVFLLKLAWGSEEMVAAITAVIFGGLIFGMSLLKRFRH